MVMREATVISERRACQLMGLSRSVLHYESKAQLENEQLKARLVELAGERRRFGYRRLHALVRREGVQANHSHRSHGRLWDFRALRGARPRPSGSFPGLPQGHSN